MAKAQAYLLDPILAGIVLYGSVWLYELGNSIVLLLAGGRVSFSVDGVLPVGTVAVINAVATSPYLKLAQVLICGSVIITMLSAVKGKRLLLTTVALITVLSAYFTSFQWELLSQLTYGSEASWSMMFLFLTALIGTLVIIVFGKVLLQGPGFGRNNDGLLSR
jgi:phosphoglycerol transferase MdoB-like AlkP superfamily enzyme